MKYQFIKNCFMKDVLVNKDYRKYNVIDNCWLNEDIVVHYTHMSIELIPIDYLKRYKH